MWALIGVGFHIYTSCCLHTAYILEEAIKHTREQHKKAYVAFVDARKAFDTVWHEGLFVNSERLRRP